MIELNNGGGLLCRDVERVEYVFDFCGARKDGVHITSERKKICKFATCLMNYFSIHVRIHFITFGILITNIFFALK